MRTSKRHESFIFILLTVIIFSVPVHGDSEGAAWPQRLVVTPGGLTYVIAHPQGFLVSDDGGTTWSPRNAGLPDRQVYPFTGGGVKNLTSLTYDPLREWRLAVTSSDSIFLSNDAGGSWLPVPVSEPVKKSAYLSSMALFPLSDTRMLLGTSFSGLFETMNAGRTWTMLKEKIGFLYRGAGFYDEISAVAYTPEGDGGFYLAVGFGNGLYRTDAARSGWESIGIPADLEGKSIDGMSFKTSGDGGWILEVTFEDAVAVLDPRTLAWGSRSEGRTAVKRDGASAERMVTAAEKSGIYVNAYRANGEYLDGHFEILEANGFNSIVVDVKNDYGDVTYATVLEAPRAAGAVRRSVDIGALLERAHEHGIYVIGRIVVFQDPRLYRYKDGAYAVWDAKKKAPWANLIRASDGETERFDQREFWVDPFSEEVWAYNIAIAKELQDLGIDEIQFDYIRFPSDGDVNGITYRHAKPGMSRIEALESFLVMARESITIPISTDLYGFNSWYRMGNWIGQNIEMLSDYVDVISPMFYPSHFPRSFLQELEYIERSRRIYREGTARALQIVRGRALIRPYVQAFLIGGELSMDEAAYSRYLIEQLEGAREGAASGFTLWNASNKYYMITRSLEEYAVRR